MATADALLQQEFDCPFCCDEVKAPKIMGPCLHSACRTCLEEYVASLGRRNAFLCPVCQQKCKIPQKGIAELKNDFKLTSIIDRYKQTKDTSRFQCSDCEKVAESLCEKCGVFLCSGCTKEHDIYTPGRHEHEIVAVCSLHGVALLYYCKTCQDAICSVCKLCSHMGGGHIVISYRDAVEDTAAKVQVVLANLYKEEYELSTSLDDVVRKTNGFKLEAGNRKGALARFNRFEEQSRNLQRRINYLRNQKATVDTMCKQLTTNITKLQNVEKERKNEVLTRSEKCQDDLKHSLKSLHDLSTNMTEKLQLVTTRKAPLDRRNAKTLSTLRQEVTELAKPENVTLMEEVKQMMHDLEPSDCDMVAVTDDFSSVKTVLDLSFPDDRPCRVIFRVKSLPDGRLVTLGISSLWTVVFSSRSRLYADTVYIHNNNGTVAKTFTECVYPATDMTVLPTGDLLLIRNGAPLTLRFFDVDRGVFNEVSIKAANAPNFNTRFWSVELDGDGNTIVDFGVSPHQYLLIQKADGTIIQSKNSSEFVALGFIEKFTNRAFIAADDKLVRFRGRDFGFSADQLFALFLLCCASIYTWFH
ncbi:E3 ubiquitin-protein ligase TRIM22-like [Lineus longissimus]|uniref:E3 ubiquitin-protein ligase TRIM22-like n=1 Tax=Lineus longissimus TaxID=88925 RepID=UPI00315CDF09